MKLFFLFILTIILIYFFNNLLYCKEYFSNNDFFKPKIIVTTTNDLVNTMLSPNANNTNNTNNNTNNNNTNNTTTNNTTNNNNNNNNNTNNTNNNNTNNTNNTNNNTNNTNNNSKPLLSGAYRYIGCYRDYPENYNTRRLKDKVKNDPMTIEECDNYANNTGYKIYGLQNFDINTGKGLCYIGNDLIRATNFDSNSIDNKNIKGDCMKYNDIIVGGVNSNALYTKYGPTFEYLGCYKENKDKIKMDENKRHIRLIDCQGAAQTNNYKYYGIKEWGNLHIFKGNCFLTNNFDENANLEQGTCVNAKAHTIPNNLSVLNDKIVGIKDNYSIYKRIDTI
jgi:hypothetical protein